MHVVRVSSLVLTLAFFLLSCSETRCRPEARPGRKRLVVPAANAAEEQKALHVPPGFEIQLVAAEPDIHKPLNLAFDDRGRLWVTDTVEYPYPAKEGTRPRDTVKILSDFGADGRARKVETFADGLNIPIGLLPLPSANAAIVHNIPRHLPAARTPTATAGPIPARCSTASSATATRTA